MSQERVLGRSGPFGFIHQEVPEITTFGPTFSEHST